MDAPQIPEGLHKCEECGEYKGQVEKDGENILMSCICEGILCPKCKKNKIRRPISNYYNEKNNSIWHDPHFTAQFGCDECRERQPSKRVDSKRLVSIISTKGKTPKEVAREAMQNLKKYEQVKAQVESQQNNDKN